MYLREIVYCKQAVAKIRSQHTWDLILAPDCLTPSGMGEENSPTVRGCKVVRPHQPGMRTHSHFHYTHRRYIAYKVLWCRKTQPTINPPLHLVIYIKHQYLGPFYLLTGFIS